MLRRCALVALLMGMSGGCFVGSAQDAPLPKPGAAYPEKAKPVEYVNQQYRFRLELPPGWEGYLVVVSRWEGAPMVKGLQAQMGPELTFRHAKWSEGNPYQDIPIMIFTRAQWRHVSDLAVSPAPVGPNKIAENSRYVFALPPRWTGYTDWLQWHEVAAWMGKHRLHAY